jgi:hypothetical protein
MVAVGKDNCRGTFLPKKAPIQSQCGRLASMQSGGLPPPESLQATSTGLPLPPGGAGPAAVPSLPASPIWYLPVALGLWAVSIFLLLQGAAFLKWATKGDDDAPDPRAGIKLAWALTAGILLFFYVQSSWFDGIVAINVNRNQSNSTWLAGLIIGLVLFPFKEPEAFSQALLFSSLPIGILATFKFLMAASLVRSTEPTSSALTRSPLSLLTAGLFTLLQLAGSIASLMALFR